MTCLASPDEKCNRSDGCQRYVRVRQADDFRTGTYKVQFSFIPNTCTLFNKAARQIRILFNGQYLTASEMTASGPKAREANAVSKLSDKCLIVFSRAKRRMNIYEHIITFILIFGTSIGLLSSLSRTHKHTKHTKKCAFFLDVEQDV